jgi:hypothetical protein
VLEAVVATVPVRGCPSFVGRRAGLPALAVEVLIAIPLLGAKLPAPNPE